MWSLLDPLMKRDDTFKSDYSQTVALNMSYVLFHDGSSDSMCDGNMYATVRTCLHAH